MKITGIIVEYNPFHNGHLYHIRKARQLSSPDLLIAVCTGNFNQRGDLSIIDKFAKTSAALHNGVDLVVELPYIFTVQNAYVFGRKAVDILKQLRTDTLVFGSETNNLEELRKYAELEVDVTRLKQLMHDGNSFPRSYGLLAGSLYPNDILAVAYLKALKDTGIVPLSIQRTNGYHSKDMDIIASAAAIRKALEEGKDVSSATSLKICDPVFNRDLYPYIRNLLITRDRTELSGIFMVNEGIENLLKENAVRYSDYEEFIAHSVSRRYTRSRIQRILLHIACNITVREAEEAMKCQAVRILGFNEKGQEYLNSIKKEIPYITQFKNLPEPLKKIEWKSSLVYSSLLKDPDAYIRRELKGPIIIK